MADKEEISKQISRRQAANRELVQLISSMIESNAGLRFHQILQIIDVEKPKEIGKPEDVQLVMTDLFNEESVVTLDRVRVKFDELLSAKK